MQDSDEIKLAPLDPKSKKPSNNAKENIEKYG